MTKVQNIFFFCAYAVLALSAIAHGETFNCERLFRSLGLEWEFGAIEIESNFEVKHDDELYSSKFRELFSFYGKNPEGNYEKNYIPQSIVDSGRLEELELVEGTHYRKDDSGKHFVLPFEKMNQENFIWTLRKVFEARGRNSDLIRLQKVPEVWKKLNCEHCDQIPDIVAEEWRNTNSFAGIEFPMKEGVQTKEELALYLKTLWKTLGIHKTVEQTPLEFAYGHVHWVPGIKKLTDPEKRKNLYTSVVGYWGDLNDAELVADYSYAGEMIFSRKTKPTGRRQVELVKKWILSPLENYSIATLTRGAYQRVHATGNGIWIQDAKRDTDKSVDKGVFPPEFKRLSFGLRGLYEPATESGHIQTVGIETRSSSVKDGLENLKAIDIDFKSEVNQETLVTHQSIYPRGVIGDIATLKARAIHLGIDPNLAQETVKVIETVQKDNHAFQLGYRQSQDSYLANLLSPLNDWLDHPLAKRNFALMNESEKKRFMQKYEKAQKHYAREINRLMQARTNKLTNYKPNIRGIFSFTPQNVVFPKEGKKVKMRNNAFLPDLSPEMWFSITLGYENARFFYDSGLSQIISMPAE